MVQQLNPIQQLQIQQTGSIDNYSLAQLSREEEQQKLREHESARDRVREGMLDPPEKVSDEMIEDAKQRKDMEEGNYLRNPENIRKIMKILNTGVTTYKTLQQIPIQVIKGLLLKSLLGPEAMAGDQQKQSLKIGSTQVASNKTPSQQNATNMLKIIKDLERQGKYIDAKALYDEQFPKA